MTVYFNYTNSLFPPFLPPPLLILYSSQMPPSPLSQLFLGGGGCTQCFLSRVVSCSMGERFVCRDLCVLSVATLLRKVTVPLPP